MTNSWLIFLTEKCKDYNILWITKWFVTFAASFFQCPVLVAWGDKDPWEPIDMGRAYGQFDSVEDFVVLPNVGHCPQVSLVSLLCARSYIYVFIPEVASSEVFKFWH